jgi:hypothetical protein
MGTADVDYRTSNGKTVESDLEGYCCDLNMVLLRHLTGQTEENSEEPQNSWCPPRDSNRVPSEYKSETLPPRQPAR